MIRWGALSAEEDRAGHRRTGRPDRPRRAAPPPQAAASAMSQFGSPSDEPGFMTMWARVYATDGVVIQQRVEEMARSVCEADPRTADERRADALAPAITHTDFVCQCGQPDCARRHRANRPPRTPSSTSWPTRNPSMPPPHRQRLVSQHPPIATRDAAESARRVSPRRLGAAGVRVRRRGAADRATGRHPRARARSAKSATPAVNRHPNRATSRRCRWPISSAAGI